MPGGGADDRTWELWAQGKRPGTGIPDPHSALEMQSMQANNISAAGRGDAVPLVCDREYPGSVVAAVWGKAKLGRDSRTGWGSAALADDAALVQRI